MADIINLDDYLEAYATGTNTYDTAAGAPQGDGSIGAGNIDPAASPQGDPNIANLPADQMDSHPKEDPSFDEDPQTPDMPEEKGPKDFEQWRKDYVKASMKNDYQEMRDLISEMQDRKLSTYHYAFVRNNFDVLSIREQNNVDRACKEIRKLVKDDFDQNNPGVSLANHMTEVLQTQPNLNNIFIKMSGMTGDKAFYHRKFIAALLGAVQVANGGTTEDIVVYNKEYDIKISTRFNAVFGDFYLGNWSIRKDDPERYLKAPELQRLEEGSPEEKEALKHRIIIDSISETFKQRAFLMTVVDDDGTVSTVGLDLETCLKSGFKDGKLVVRTNTDDGSEAMIDDDGAIIGLVEIKVMFVKESGEVDDNGKPYKRELEFLVRRQGRLYLSTTLQTVKEAASSFPGIIIRETPYTGNPSDLKVLKRCVPSASDVLFKTCM